ncbi:FG-GAP repeat domain-containing protein [Streptomyces sp. NPDC057486]|uniref:FG-GAP repeat domain-containing protein n=1 Tax=Streptomyces sp. NPDC057486 TaxID=3346145 RepID=UPI00368A52BA
MLVSAAALLAGCGDGRGDPPSKPKAGPAIRTCVTSSGGLRADLNGDGTADQVSRASLTGAGLRITFGATHGAGTSVSPRQLVGDRGEGAVDVMGVVADFDRDGWLDLFIAATGPMQGDDPMEPAVSELRLGPFSARGRGQSDNHVELSEPRAVGVTDYNHDRYPDLAAYIYRGDGVYAVQARLGGAKGLDREPDDSNRRYTAETEQTGVRIPDSMPDPGLRTFYPSCEDKGQSDNGIATG